MSFTPEFELLLCCARTHADPARIMNLLEKGLDWAPVLRLAHANEVMPLLASSLRATGWEMVPEAVQKDLHGFLLANVQRNLHLTGELLRLVDLFASHDIPLIALKGPVLTVSLYGDLSRRQFVDLDLLVHPMDAIRAKKPLVAQGYRPQFDLTAAQEPAFLRYACELGFSRERDGLLVELQWQFVPRYFTLDVDWTQVWKRAVSVPFMGRSVLSLSPEDLLLYLCVHGTKHAWTSLKWICDVAELLRASPNLDWELVFKQARSSGSERMLHLGLWLAHDLLGAEVPSHMNQDPATRNLVAEVCTRLSATDAGMSSRQEAFFHLRSRERFLDRLRYCYRLLTTHTIHDWQSTSFPRPLFFLYNFVRPFRLIWKYWTGGIRKN